LVGHDAGHHTIQAGQADNHVRREVLLNLKETAHVEDALDYLLDVVGLVGIGRHKGIEGLVGASRIILGSNGRGIIHIVLRQVGHQLAHHLEACFLVVGRKVGHAADAVVHHSPAQILEGDLFVSDGLDHFGSRDEHMARLLDHEGKVRQSRGIDSSSCAGTHNNRDLWDNARCQRIAEENIGITAKGHDAFLNARAARIVDPDDGRAVLQGQVLDLGDLGGMSLAKGPTHDGEILGKDVDQPAADRTIARDHPITQGDALAHAKIAHMVCGQGIQLLEAALVQQRGDALSSGHLAFFMLLFNRAGAAALLGFVFQCT